MKNIFMLLLFSSLVSACQLAPCLTKDSFISASNATFEDFKNNQNKFSDKDWLAMDNDYKKYLDDCYLTHEEKLTEDDKKQFWLHTSQYFIKRGYKGPDMLESIQNSFSKGLERYLESVSESLAEKFTELMDVNFDNAVDKIFDIFENWGEKND